MNAQELLAAVQAKFPTVQELPKVAGQARSEDIHLSVPAAALVEVCRFLRFDPPLSFDSLAFVTSIDWKTHYEVVYYMTSILHKHKLVIKVKLEDRGNPEVQTVSPIWAAADWQEREIFDLMGIKFQGHYNMRRILLPDDWEGFPLRKDYVAKPDRYD